MTEPICGVNGWLCDVCQPPSPAPDDHSGLKPPAEGKPETAVSVGAPPVAAGEVEVAAAFLYLAVLVGGNPDGRKNLDRVSAEVRRLQSRVAELERGGQR